MPSFEYLRLQGERSESMRSRGSVVAFFWHAFVGLQRGTCVGFCIAKTMTRRHQELFLGGREFKNWLKKPHTHTHTHTKENSLVVQWLGLGSFTAKGPGSIPGWGTKIPQAMQRGQKKKKSKTDCHFLFLIKSISFYSHSCSAPVSTLRGLSRRGG